MNTIPDSPALHDGAQKPPEEARSLVDRWGIHPWGYAIVVLAVIFFTYQVIGSVLTFVIFKSAAVTSQNAGWFRLATCIGQLFLLLLPTVILGRLQTPKLRLLFRIKMPAVRSIWYAFIGLISLQQVLEVYLYFQDMIPIPPWLQPMVEELRKMIDSMYTAMISAQSVPELLTVIIVVALIPAVCEELLFRGLVQDNFQRGSPKPWLGFIITGAVFGIYHLNPFAVVPLIALGIYFGYIVYRSESIVIAMIAHFINNLIAVLASYFNITNDIVSSISTGKPETAPVLLNLIFFSLLFLVSVIAFHRSIRPAAALDPDLPDDPEHSSDNVQKEG